MLVINKNLKKLATKQSYQQTHVPPSGTGACGISRIGQSDREFLESQSLALAQNSKFISRRAARKVVFSLFLSGF